MPALRNAGSAALPIAAQIPSSPPISGGSLFPPSTLQLIA
jgi:hypothetical protein